MYNYKYYISIIFIKKRLLYLNRLCFDAAIKFAHHQKKKRVLFNYFDMEKTKKCLDFNIIFGEYQINLRYIYPDRGILVYRINHIKRIMI